MSGRGITAGFVVVNTVLLWLATAIAAVALWPIYHGEQLIVLLGATLLAGSAVAILGALYRWSTLIVVLVSIVIYLAIGTTLAVPEDTLHGLVPTLGGLLDLLRGTALGWKQLLTITLPVGGYQALLVPAFVLVLVSTVCGLSIALRSRRGELAALAPVGVFLVAIAFGPARVSWPLPTALGLLAVVLVWCSWWRRYRRRRAIRLLAAAEGGAVDQGGRSVAGARSVLSVGLIVLVAAGASVAATVAAPPSAPRQVLRTAIVQPFDPRDYPSPLSGFRRYEEPADANSPMLSVTGLPKGARIRIATLDSYDGIVYAVGSDRVTSLSGSFTRVPSTVDQSSTRGRRVTIDVTVGDYAGVWLPTVGKLESVDFSGADATDLRNSFYYNNTSGTAAVVRKLGAGDHYTLETVLPRQPGADAIASLRPGTATVPSIGVLPDQLGATLDGWVDGVHGAGARLAAMLATMKKTGYVSHGVSEDEPASRSGHAADRITELLTDQRMIGDQEQYSVTAALMAQQLGFPARVVFGFAPSDTTADGATTILGSDVSAWIEVDTAQYGWVTIDPTPPIRQIPAEQPEEPTTIARPQSPVQPPPAEPDTHDTQVPPDTTQDRPSTPNQLLAVLLLVARVLGWTVLGVAVLLSPLLTIVATKARRRSRRRRAPTPLQRIRGGWQEFEDAVVDHGFVPPPSPTRTEVAATVGGLQPLVLASVTDRAVFSPEGPESAEADRVWRSVGDLRTSLDAGLTRRQRILAAISLRSLGR